MSVTVKLGTYVLPEDHSIYKYFPGKEYKFYDIVSRTSLAIIDVRDLDKLDPDPTKWDRDKLLDAISKDRVERAVERGLPRPSRLVHSVGDKQAQTFLNALFFEACKGDLILMPAKGYTSLVNVGRLLDEPGVLQSITAKDGAHNHRYYGRRVKWIGQVEKRLLSTSLIKLLHSQAAFFDIGIPHYEEVYRRAFDSYVYDGQFITTYRTEKPIFTPKDNFLVSVWFELLEVLVEAHDEGNPLPEGSIYDLVVSSDIAEDERDDLSISIQSPGWFRLRSVFVSPLVSMALFAMAAQGVAYSEAVEAKVSAHVVRQADKQCLADVDAAVRDYIQLLGKVRWEQACVLAKRAEQETKLKTDADLRRTPQPAKRRK